MEGVSTQEPLEIGSLLERYAPPEDVYEIELPHGERFTFRAIKSYSELRSFERDAINWFQSLPRKGSSGCDIHPFKDHLPKDADAAVAAYSISRLSVSPKIEQLDALKMLAAPWLVRFFMKSIDIGNRTIGSIYEGKLLEDAKNESGETDGGDGSSPSPGTPSASTPTS